MSESGHVFVLRGNLTRLWCDAWLMPCDSSFAPREHWYAGTLEPNQTPQVETGERVHPRARRVVNWPQGGPAAWMVDVGGGRAAPPAWFVAGVREWLDTCAPQLAAARVTARARPLVALPLVGTGLGGAADRAGEVVRLLLPVLYDGAEKHGIDIALVTFNGPAHAAALLERRRLADPRSWPHELTEERRRHAAALAGHARRGNLVVFVGAGASMGAGLPGWDDMLAELAREVGIGREPDDEQLTEFMRLSHPDRARLIAHRLQVTGGRAIGEAVADYIGGFDRYSVSHLLLAGLPARAAVTTNYDRLYEQASEDVGDPVSVLPYEPSGATRSWLLKLHGCIRHPEDIVLTRADYLRYDQRRAALRGVVQAMLMTRHMLFVGFSMNDDNFHRIVDDVLRAVRGEDRSGGRPGGSDALATTLSIETNAFFDELWSGDIRRVDLAAGSTIVSARLLEIFCDYVAAEASATTTHLLDDAYAFLLDDGETEVRDALLALSEQLSPRARDTEAWRFVEVWLGRLGQR